MAEKQADKGHIATRAKSEPNTHDKNSVPHHCHMGQKHNGRRNVPEEQPNCRVKNTIIMIKRVKERILRHKTKRNRKRRRLFLNILTGMTYALMYPPVRGFCVHKHTVFRSIVVINKCRFQQYVYNILTTRSTCTYTTRNMKWNTQKIARRRPNSSFSSGRV